MPGNTKAPPEKALTGWGLLRIRIHLTNKESGTERHVFCAVDTSIGAGGG